jgi:hypothetical protein
VSRIFKPSIAQCAAHMFKPPILQHFHVTDIIRRSIL